MASLTLKEIPDELIEQLRELAEQEERSLDQQVVLLLEQSLTRRRTAFVESLSAFIERHGPSPLDDGDFVSLRSPDRGRDVVLS